MVIQQDFSQAQAASDSGSLPARRRFGGGERCLSRGGEVATRRTRLWWHLALATGVYGVAHLLFGLRWASARTAAITADIEVGGKLFLLGLFLLARLTRTLHEPAAAHDPAARELAGCSLVVTMALSFSPCLWFLLFRM
jgi:hypothetical protein